jgi:hypothetical protein
LSFKIGLENGIEGRSLAWGLEQLGLFAYGLTGVEALKNLPAAIQEYRSWIASHDAQFWSDLADVEFEQVETFQVYVIDEQFDLAQDGYEVNAWFLHDWKPLLPEEIERGLTLLAWSRQDLLATVEGLDKQTMNTKQAGERWSINGILRHVGGAEWWYLDRLGMAIPREEVPEEPFERLEKIRAQLIRVLPGMVGSNQVVGIDGEIWSPRKLLRRAVWHERDHTAHIQKLKQRA